MNEQGPGNWHNKSWIESFCPGELLWTRRFCPREMYRGRECPKAKFKNGTRNCFQKQNYISLI